MLDFLRKKKGKAKTFPRTGFMEKQKPRRQPGFDIASTHKNFSLTESYQKKVASVKGQKYIWFLTKFSCPIVIVVCVNIQTWTKRFAYSSRRFFDIHIRLEKILNGNRPHKDIYCMRNFNFPFFPSCNLLTIVPYRFGQLFLRFSHFSPKKTHLFSRHTAAFTYHRICYGAMQVLDILDNDDLIPVVIRHRRYPVYHNIFDSAFCVIIRFYIALHSNPFHSSTNITVIIFKIFFNASGITTTLSFLKPLLGDFDSILYL
nr:MAG TPA: hypothetical protein [Caudoviricetes sp.]